MSRIAIRPQPWTHHHVHRLYHLSMAICFGFVSLVIVAGMAVGIYAKAENPQSDAISITASVEGINPGEITPTPTGSKPPVSTTNPTITIVAEPQGEVPTQPLGNNTAYVFDQRKPIFSGTTSVSNGIVFLYVQGPMKLNSTVQAGPDGKWLWQSPDLLPEGNYLITAVVYDSYNLNRYATAHAYFIIDLPGPPAKPGQPGYPGTPGVPGQPGTSIPPTNPEQPPVVPQAPSKIFGIFFKIMDQYKVVETGSFLKAWVTLVSNNEKQINNQQIHYTIISPRGRVILDTTDTVSFTNQSQYQKTFNIAPQTPTGKYTIRVSSTYSGIESVVSDTFFLKNPPFVAAVAPQGPAIVWSLLLLLLLLFLVLVYLAYRYVRHHSRELNQPASAA
jgi:hypothetical protein